MHRAEKQAFAKSRVLLSAAGIVLLLLLVVRVHANPGNRANVTTLSTSIQETMLLSLLAVDDGSDLMSSVDIPVPPLPRSPYRPPGWDKGPKPPDWIPPGLEE